jgi:CRISPR-associated protein Csx17
VDTDAALPIPLEAHRFCSAATISAFLSDAVDVETIGRWVPALSLIRWTKNQAFTESMLIGQSDYVPDEAFLLQALFRPLFYPRQLQIGGKELFPEHLRPRAATARRLLNLIRQGEMSEAVELARSRYLAAGRSIVLPPPDLSADYERVAASLLIPMKPPDVEAGLRRWLQPAKNKLRGE